MGLKLEAKYNISKLDYATVDNPFAGRVICGQCESLLVGRYGTLLMKDNEELCGGVIRNMSLKGKGDARISI